MGYHRFSFQGYNHWQTIERTVSDGYDIQDSMDAKRRQRQSRNVPGKPSRTAAGQTAGWTGRRII